MLEILKEFDKERFHQFYQDSEIGDFINEIAPYINRRSYIKIEVNGNISKKTVNYALPLLSVTNDQNEKEILDYIFENCIDFSEKVSIKKIDRLSNFTNEKLNKNLFKILFNRDRSFALRYCKELFLRDEKNFFTLLYRFVLMNDISSKKVLMLRSFEELAKKVKEKAHLDSLLFCLLDYLVNYETNFYKYTHIEKTEDKSCNFDFKSLEEAVYYEGIKRFNYYSIGEKHSFMNILAKENKISFEIAQDFGYDLKAETILLNYMNKGE